MKYRIAQMPESKEAKILVSFQETLIEISKFAAVQQKSREIAVSPMETLESDLDQLLEGVNNHYLAYGNDNKKLEKIITFINVFNTTVKEALKKEIYNETAVKEVLKAAQECEPMLAETQGTERTLNIVYRVLDHLAGLILGVILGTAAGLITAFIGAGGITHYTGQMPDPAVLKIMFPLSMAIGALSGGGYGAYMGCKELCKKLCSLILGTVNRDAENSTERTTTSSVSIKEAATPVFAHLQNLLLFKPASKGLPAPSAPPPPTHLTGYMG